MTSKQTSPGRRSTVTWCCWLALLSMSPSAICANDSAEHRYTYFDSNGQASDYLPETLSVPDRNGEGFRLVKFNLVQASTLSVKGLENGRVKQGGFLRFRIEPPAAATDLRPVRLRWQAIEMFGAIQQSVKTTQPSQLAGEVAIPLSPAEVDLIWDTGFQRTNPKSIPDNEKREIPFQVRNHLIVDAHRFVAANHRLQFRAQRSRVRQAVTEWAKRRGTQNDAAAKADEPPDWIPYWDEADRIRLVRQMIASGAVTITTDRPDDPEWTIDNTAALSVFTIIRRAWMKFDLVRLSANTDGRIAVDWNPAPAAPDMIEAKILDWAPIEIYQPLQVTTQNADWDVTLLSEDDFSAGVIDQVFEFIAQPQFNPAKGQTIGPLALIGIEWFYEEFDRETGKLVRRIPETRFRNRTSLLASDAFEVTLKRNKQHQGRFSWRPFLYQEEGGDTVVAKPRPAWRTQPYFSNDRDHFYFSKDTLANFGSGRQRTN